MKFRHKSILLISSFIVCTANAGLAQQTPAWEFFTGYSFQASDVREYYKTTPIIYTFRQTRANLNGWDASITENRNRWFGGTLDLSGHYATPQLLGISNRERLHSILYGPRFSYRRPFGTAFAHMLFGAALTKVSVAPTGPHASDFSFGFGAGVGLDIQFRSQAAFRVAQIDYLRANALGSAQNHLRLSVGVVLQTGAAK